MMQGEYFSWKLLKGFISFSKGAKEGGVCMAEEKKHRLRITYEIDGEVIKVIEREISEKYKWFMVGNSIWREY